MAGHSMDAAGNRLAVYGRVAHAHVQARQSLAAVTSIETREAVITCADFLMV